MDGKRETILEDLRKGMSCAVGGIVASLQERQFDFWEDLIVEGRDALEKVVGWFCRQGQDGGEIVEKVGAVILWRGLGLWALKEADATGNELANVIRTGVAMKDRVYRSW